MSKSTNNKTDKVRSKQGKIQFNIYQEITSIVIIVSGLLMGISLYLNAGGIFGTYFKRLSFGLLGYISFIIPLIVIVYGIHYTIKKGEIGKAYKYILVTILILTLSAIVHIIFYTPDIEMTFKESVSFFYYTSQLGCGGGVIGFLIGAPLINFLGICGSSIILIAFIIIIGLIITEISFFKIIGKLFILIKNKIKDTLDIKLKKTGLKEEKDLINTDKNYDKDIIIEELGQVVLDIKNKEQNQNLKGKKQDEKKLNIDQDEENKTMIEVASSHNKKTDDYIFPPKDLLSLPTINDDQKTSLTNLRTNAKKLTATLKSFGVDAKIMQVSKGPTVTRYELQPNAGVKVSKIVNLADDIALNLAASMVRIEAPIPGKAAIGIEIPNEEITTVHFREVIESDEFSNHPSKLAFALGKDIAGKSIVADIGKMPHLLIAGATGSGKSVCINTLIMSILYNAHPDEVKLVMIDPKVVELGIYNGIPHLLIPVVTDPKKAAGALNWAVHEMTERYTSFADNNVRDLEGYNQLIKERQEGDYLPNIIIIIDELSDLMMVAPNEVEDSICRLAQMARAAGMHLIIATQRPSVDVITGVIKANIPSRISFAVASQVDSRTVLDMGGAEKLLGKGDMLFYPSGASKPKRLQGALVLDKEVESVVKSVKVNSNADYNEDIIEKIETENQLANIEEDDTDELLSSAIDLVVNDGQASISMIQRRLKVGYARAARMIDQMELRGIVGEFQGSKPRQVLISKEEYNEMLMHSSDDS